MVCLLMVALTLAGCATRQAAPPVTEVQLTETAPFPISTNVLDLPDARGPGPSTPSTTNSPGAARPRVPVQTGGWVFLADWSGAQGLGRPRELAGERYQVDTPQGPVVFQAGSQKLAWHGTLVWLGYAPRYLRGQPCVHALDVEKTLEPLLRPPPPIARVGRKVVIDPGHGGTDGGTQGTPQQLEKNYTLDWALRLERLLAAAGWQVFLTRTNDVDLSLPARAELADRVGADLFVSLHFNGLAGGSDHGGIETFHVTPAGLPSTIRRGNDESSSVTHPANTYDAESLACAYRIHRELVSATRAADGGVRRARFLAVLRGQRRPAVLIEGGFLTNPAEARRIATPEYRQKLAEAVARALTPLPPTAVASQR